MKAVIYNGPRDVQVREVPDPRIERPTDVLVRITSTNICGSDLHMYEGRTDFEQGRIGVLWTTAHFASITSRRPSPSKLNPSATMQIAKPGNVATHHWSKMNFRPVEIMAPHSGSGGCAPKPMKPRPAAVRMMPAMSKVMRTMTDERHIGMMWKTMMRNSLAPARRTALT